MSRETLSEAEITWAYRRWCEGYSLPEIGQALFIHPSTVKAAFVRRNLVRQRKTLVYPAATRADQLRDMDNAELAQELVRLCPMVAFWLENPERKAQPRTEYAIGKLLEYLGQEVHGNGK